MNVDIREKIDSIAECVFTEIKELDFGLYSGEFGILLFLFYYSKYSNKKNHSILTEKYAKRLLEQVTKRTRLHTFCSGFSGILYLFEFLRENDFIDMDVSNVQPALDRYLVNRMRQDIQRKIYDFMHGALGVGIYFLKKGTKPEYIQKLILQELFDFLYSTAEKDIEKSHFRWESVVLVNDENRIAYNLALSHGISSIIIFLSRLVKNGISNGKTEEMIAGAINYVLSHEMNFSQFGSFFPNYLLKNSSHPILKSRLGWCYGDLGIGSALWQAGKTLSKIEWMNKGLEILLESTQRQSINENSVQDAGICHGSAGIAMVYRRMYLETSIDEFNEATKYWINQTLNFSYFSDGLAGYKTFEKNGCKLDYSLLSGISGIGLVLLSYKENDLQTWDELFLIS